VTQEASATGREPAGSPCPDASAGAGAAADALLLALVGASLGTLYALLALDIVRPAFLLGNSIEPGTRQLFFRIVVGAGLAGVALAAALHVAALRATDAALAQARLSQWLRRLRPLTLAWLLPILLDHQAWVARSLFLILVSFASAVLLSFWLRDSWLLRPRAFDLGPSAARTSLAAAMAAYALYVSHYAIQHHQRLGTSAYDLGIMENVFWNTAHGRLFASAIERGGSSHLAVHTSFIYLLFVPIYAVAQRPETLLVLQSVVFALGAWPLFLVARELLPGRMAALVVALLYLAHPAVGGANFYDFHELAFAPPLFFAAAWFWLRRSRLLWIAVVLLLLVKEDMPIVVLLLGMFSLLSRRRAEGIALAAVGLASYVILQHVVIPHFAHGPSDFTWYFEDMIPRGEGPLGLIRTMVVNPLYSLGFALSERKLLYLAQALSPLAFLCFLGARGWVLMAYGLLLALFASREPVFSLGFQYALLLVPQAFVAAVVHAAELPADRRRQAWFVAVTMSLLIGYHHGMLYPRRDFMAGFWRVGFAISAAERARFVEVEAMARMIPPEASVTASERLVSHVARRERVQTIRYAGSLGGRGYDYYFVLGEEVDPQVEARYPEVFGGGDYALIEKGRFVQLYQRRVAPP
jgi:uncharacterized membrane protein